MPKTLLFFSCEPGGAEVLIPVVRLVRQETDHNLIVLGYGLGAERFAAKWIDCNVITPVSKNDPAFFDTYSPDLVITSATSLPERDMSEKYLWQISREKGIPTLAFLDQWQNYAIRFSGPAVNEKLAYLPDYINCIDAVGETEMIREGFNRRRLVKFGHPYLSTLKESAAVINEDEIRQRFGVATSQRIVLFVSEAIREHFGQSRGYDQYDALRLFLEILSESNEDVIPIIKLHPKDTILEYERMLAGYECLRPVIVRNELTSIECIKISQVVYGMTSIMLLEAFVLDKKVISLQPRLQGEDPLILSRFGLIPKITDSKVNMLAKNVQIEISPSIKLDFVFKKSLFLDFLRRQLDR
jgi:hypothetical protein